ncbi:MAG: hypothetical protein A2599_01635 [Candidatus Staskawiczbacteria bacterium RIFOXYD1_FULL_39_28]|uniref:NodB homology domain-containing protein n=1 Tax=Candidatus Staskawiczbacteria bacterium RIFOXYC1_FULL_38_18 TaxID=1802229 RepID=A0A1G2J944_9BACT|nr:MAG: hypothetical protein A2401_00380 [Candidatus Staskawiczbacteria bacterium RIFOXYC1_FULL_38_18]OGZ92019.1 MAG: hypothetical protein A2599_01635 [Candidatus Staskawiczbacteria bacterium RIFOXYD1_FULL_39_28]
MKENNQNYFKKVKRIIAVLSALAVVASPFYGISYVSAAPFVFVTITSPRNASTVSGTVGVGVKTSDDSAVSQLQIYIDNIPLGPPLTRAPYSAVWDTCSTTNRMHKVSATAKDISGKNWSTFILVSVSNSSSACAPATYSNLILNPSLENGSATPDNWFSAGWGSNNAVFNYPITGRTGKGAGITISNYIDGDAKWHFVETAVTPGAQYLFSNFYQSDTATQVVARFTYADTSVSYLPLGAGIVSPGWTQFLGSFTAPSNAVSVTVFHLIGSAGFLFVDDYSLSQANSLTFDQGMVSLNFDDGLPSFYTNGVPILDSHGLKGTNYVLSGELGNSSSITAEQMLELQSKGYEIGGHSKTHRDLTTLSDADLREEIIGSKNFLESLGAKISTFAFPFGTHNSLVDQIVKEAGFTGSRTALARNEGENYKNNNPYALRSKTVDASTTLAQVQQWIDDAIKNKTWIILVFHGIDNSGSQFSSTPQTLNAICDYIKSKNVKTVTNAQGVGMMTQ